MNDRTGVVPVGHGPCGCQLGGLLEAILPAGKRLAPERLMAEAARIATDAKLGLFMAPWMEANAAARGTVPSYTGVALQVTADFVDWIEIRLELSSRKVTKTSPAYLGRH